jgi:3-methyladenine DNA glycosylase/8-oxoguanine DNA glycosylase
MVIREGALTRALWVGDEQVVVRARPAGSAVRVTAECGSREAGAIAIERMRFALGTDHDLSEFHRRFRWDPLIGPVIRRTPWLRPWRRPEPFEALAWAVCEQLIESGRASAIQRRIVRRHGRRSACGTLRTPPSAARLAGRSPAELDACGLAPKRSIALIRAAREVASGRADLREHEPAWRRLRTIPNIGNWTLEMLAVTGQGRDDQLPALDVAYLKFVGLPYGEYAALAGWYALRRRFSE